MPLYSSFNTSDYYDDEPVVKKPTTQPVQKKPQEFKKPHQIANDYGLTDKKRKSLYSEAQEIATRKSEYNGINFKDLYRAGQAIQVKGPNGEFRTRNGRIIEIVDKNLMYVAMEDSHKDVHDNWLIDFVMDTDTIIKI